MAGRRELRVATRRVVWRDALGHWGQRQNSQASQGLKLAGDCVSDLGGGRGNTTWARDGS